MAARLALLLTAAAAASCSAGPLAPELAAPAPVFSPQVFFEGRTEGRGTLDIILKDEQPVFVQGRGRTGPDGTLVLDQIVRRGTRPPEKRQWRIREVGPGRYSGTLTDATGPVRGEVDGNRLHLSYPMKGGVRAEQWIYLQPDGRTALNRMAITKWGVQVARLDETISKVD